MRRALACERKGELGMSERDVDAVLERFDGIVRETMVHLHRARGERQQRRIDRVDLEAERDDIRALADREVRERVTAAAGHARGALDRAIRRIDGILGEGTPEDA